MGYKLAGYDVLGGVEIDPQMMRVYRHNHKPKHSFLMGVQDFKKLNDDKLPDELFDLDILDGSPPCSVFSTAGARDKKWGSEHHFREGQAVQKLDDLFFEFIDVAEKLKPKVVVAENVRGLIIGKAKGYVKEIFRAFRKAGYNPQLFLLNAAFMGVPQKRERTFFVASRSDLGLPKIKMEFKEEPISANVALTNTTSDGSKRATIMGEKLWSKTKPGDSFSKAHPRGSWFNFIKLHPNKPSCTITSRAAAGSMIMRWDEPRALSNSEVVRLQSFPDDYDSLDADIKYMCGMSVPPLMMERVANQIELQWLSRLK